MEIVHGTKLFGSPFRTCRRAKLICGSRTIKYHGHFPKVPCCLAVPFAYLRQDIRMYGKHVSVLVRCRAHSCPAPWPPFHYRAQDNIQNVHRSASLSPGNSDTNRFYDFWSKQSEKMNRTPSAHGSRASQRPLAL